MSDSKNLPRNIEAEKTLRGFLIEHADGSVTKTLGSYQDGQLILTNGHQTGWHIGQNDDGVKLALLTGDI